jgi:DNA-binding response OmpR family regulator
VGHGKNPGKFWKNRGKNPPARPTCILLFLYKCGYNKLGIFWDPDFHVNKGILANGQAKYDGGRNGMAKRLLLVDDEPLILKGLRYSLEQDGYEVDSASDGEEALRMFEAGLYDLILLDVMLPELSGIEVCQRIRETSTVPIIMLTAKGEDMDKILGLEYGADDYMTKPFNILEVKARVKSILRRAAATPAAEPQRLIRVRDMEVNLANRSVSIAGKDVKLTAKEFDLLQMFITNRGKVFSRENMLETVWKYDYLGDMRTVDVHIRRLREKIERNTSQPEFIFTKWGVGYFFTDKD